MDSKDARASWPLRLALAALVALAAFLRLYGLGAESLWLDEGVSLRISRMDVPGIFEAVKTDNNPPLYYLLLHYWIALFGDSEVSLRAPSALAGALTVLAIYKVGNLLSLERPAALLAALLLAVAPLHLEYSQEARTYELAVALALLSFYFFVRLCRAEGDREGRTLATRAGYVLCTILLVYSHVYGLFVVLAQNLHVLALALLGARRGAMKDRRPRFTLWAVLQGTLLVLYAPGLALLYGWVSSPGQRGWIPEPTVRSVYEAFASYAGSSVLLVLLAALSAGGAVSLARRAPDTLLLLSLWLLVPLAVPFAVSLVSTPIFAARYGILATPALYLLACQGVQATVRWLPRTSWARGTAYAAASVLAVALAAGPVLTYYEEPNKPQWREAAAYVEARAERGDLVVVAPGYQAEYALGYYLDDPATKMLPWGNGRLRAQGAASTPEDLALVRTAREANRSDRVWLVVANDEISAKWVRQALLNRLFVGTHERRQYEGVEVRLLQKRPPGNESCASYRRTPELAPRECVPYL